MYIVCCVDETTNEYLLVMKLRKKIQLRRATIIENKLEKTQSKDD